MTTTPNLGMTTWDPGNAQPDLLYNYLLSVIDALVPTPIVLDKDLTAPPGSPTPGSLYIVASPATGLWVGREDSLVVYTYANAWLFIAPKEDWLVFVADENEGYRYDGTSWQVDSSGGSGFTNPMTTLGDLIVGGASGTPGRLGIGTTGQVLTVVGGTWAPATPVSGFTNPMTAAGDLIVGGTSGAATRLAKGADGTVLGMVSGGQAYFDPTLISQNLQSTAYTLVLADKGKHLYHPSADTSARTFTIPANSSVAFPIGTAITFVNDVGAGTVTIAITTDTLVLAGAGSTGSRTLAPGGMATALKLTSTRWIISGNGLS